MQPDHMLFRTQIEYQVGDALSRDFYRLWPAYQRWFGLSKLPISAIEGRANIAAYMPELLGTYDTLCANLHLDEQAATFFSLYNPPGFPTGCSQMAWAKGGLANNLIRNYDFPAELCEKKLLLTNWNGTKVMAMTDCVWGVLDGINEHGLTASLAYGGRVKRGEGFAITLVLRYVLEFCLNVQQAVEVLNRVPISMPYNVTLFDRSGEICTVEICPGEAPRVTKREFATNHQHKGEVENLDAVADSSLRESYIATRIADPKTTGKMALDMFLKPPLYRNAKEWRGWGTLYTACYNVKLSSVSLIWPGGQRMDQSIAHFSETSLLVNVPAFASN